jgi:hypothetical protein
MRNLFPGYYKPTKEEFDDLWENCIFSFDANILLNVYRYSPETRERFFEILTKLQDRIWIPYQVAYEYHKNRLEVISQQLKPYDEIKKLLDEHFEKLIKKLEEYSKRHSFTTFFDSSKLIESIKRANEESKVNLQQASSQYPDLLEFDEFLEKVTRLFDSKVGKPYPEEEIQKIYKEGEKRFKDNIPPGYMDDRGKHKKDFPENYGDILVWFQLIDYAKSQKKPLILVIDDEKEDWWLEHKGKTISPRPELIQEMLSKAGISFYMYKSDQFMERAANFLALPDKPEAIEEAREIRLQDADEEHSYEEIQHLVNITPRNLEASKRAFEESQRKMARNLEASKRAFEESQRKMARNMDRFPKALPLTELREQVSKLRGVLKGSAPDRNLVDELIQERRKEAASE